MARKRRPRSRFGLAAVESQVLTWLLVTDGPCRHKRCREHGKETGIVIATLLAMLQGRLTKDEAVERLHCFGAPSPAQHRRSWRHVS